MVFAGTWIFRWLTIDFTNDHFVHLSRARQILLGELPVRDFFDPGLPLHYYASAAAMSLSGQNLLGEAVLTVTLVALGAALTFYLAARSSGSLLLAAVATFVAVAMFPRLYNYPKVFLYPLALTCIWWYARGRTTAALAALAAVTAGSVLFRLDHGVYVALAAAVGVVLANRDRIRAVPPVLARFAAITAALLLPFFVFIQWTAGIPTYVSDVLSQSSSVAGARILAMPISLDWSRWVVVDPPAHPRVSIRWQPTITDEERRAREQKYQLNDGVGDRDATWSYVLGNPGRDTIQALLGDPLLADTHNIDRGALTPVVTESWLQRARNRFGLLRTHFLPGVLTSANALAWLYYATVFVPVAALIVLLVRWRRATLTPLDTATIGTTVVMCLVIHQALIRDSPDSRLPDVAGPTVVLAAWLTSLVPRRVAAAAIVLWLGTLWAATTFGETGERISATAVLAGPSAIVERIKEVNRSVRMRPIDFYAAPDSTGIRALTRYVLECTRPRDRILTGSFEPQVFFYAERGFAGGQVYLRNGWHGSERDQRLTIERMQRQRVPIVLISAPTEAGIQRGFPLVYRYVQDNYREAERASFGGDREYVVFVKAGLQARGIYPPLDLPCYR